MKPTCRPYSTFARSATAVSICQGLSRIACLGATIREDFVELLPRNARKALACNSARLAGREHLFRMCGIPRNRLLANRGQTRAPRTAAVLDDFGNGPVIPCATGNSGAPLIRRERGNSGRFPII